MFRSPITATLQLLAPTRLDHILAPVTLGTTGTVSRAPIITSASDKERATIATSTPPAPTPLDHIIALATLDFMGMESTAPV